MALPTEPDDRPRGNGGIRTPDQRLRVFVSSTLGELAEERRAVSRAIMALRLTPVMFELGARPHAPQRLYHAYLDQSDIFIGLYWQRAGQLVPGTELSGLEDEFALSASLPRLVYVKSPAPDREPRLAQLLDRVAAETSSRTFRTPAELGRLVRDDLATLMSERFSAAMAAPARPLPVGGPPPLPTALTSLVGREREIQEVSSLLGRPDVRLVTLTGPVGVGKTRLAVALGERVRDRFESAVFVALSGIATPELVLPYIGRAAGAQLLGTSSPLDAVAAHLGDAPWLVILDNLEQVVGAARDIDALLARCRRLRVLATSLTAFGLRAEREYPVRPLAIPASADADALAASPAVELFVDRARAVRPGFALTPRNRAAVAEICRRLEGLPLAIELAAARTRLLDPDALLRRLATSLDALGSGTVDLPERQHTLRATVEWSLSLLDEDERSLLEVMAVFSDGWTLEAAADVARLDESDVLRMTEALARHSLVFIDMTERGPRSRMLLVIREFMREHLDARPDAEEIRRRHADYYCRLAERADRPLRSTGQQEWSERVQAETCNLSDAVRWYLRHDRTPLPHLFRVLSPFRVLAPWWGLRDDVLDDAHTWISELLPSAGSLAPTPRAELLWTAAVTALERGDSAMALAIEKRLSPLLDGLDDPYLQAVSHLAIAWTWSLVRDLEPAWREASAALECLRGQDEPLWTGLALVTVGSIEIGMRRLDDAERHLTELRELAERFDNAFLTANALLHLGAVERSRGRLAEARTLLEEGLELGVAAGSTHSVTWCLSEFAKLALAEGRADRAALIAGAVVGLRSRAGLRSWTALQGEGELLDAVRRALGRDRFEALYAEGTELDQPQAVAVAREAPGAPAQEATRAQG